MSRFKYTFFLLAILLVFSFSGCKVSYSFSGADIPAGANTFSVDYFKVSAPLASPVYSQRITEQLKDLMLTQTRLSLAKSNGDLQFSGIVTRYDVQPVALQGNETAGLNRLTIGVRVSYVNMFDEKKNFEREFSQFEDFKATESLNQVETKLIEAINLKLVQDIFNASLGNW